jgi:anti-anti-sigma factor
MRLLPASHANAIIAGMRDSSMPVEWHGRQAIVVLPEHIDLGNASPIRDQLLTLINRGAAAVVLDMTGTTSCDHGGVDVIARAYQRAVINGTPLRLAVAAPAIRRVLSIEGIDRLVSIFRQSQRRLPPGHRQNMNQRPTPPDPVTRAQPGWRLSQRCAD